MTAGLSILCALGLRKTGVEIVSCPTCGRCRVDLAAVVQQVKQALKGIEAPLTVAVMGCVVNGPGEAKEADIGIAFAPGGCMLFKKASCLPVRTIALRASSGSRRKPERWQRRDKHAVEALIPEELLQKSGMTLVKTAYSNHQNKIFAQFQCESPLEYGELQLVEDCLRKPFERPEELEAQFVFCGGENGCSRGRRPKSTCCARWARRTAPFGPCSTRSRCTLTAAP